MQQTTSKPNKDIDKKEPEATEPKTTIDYIPEIDALDRQEKKVDEEKLETLEEEEANTGILKVL